MIRHDYRRQSVGAPDFANIIAIEITIWRITYAYFLNTVKGCC
jgi:hypothetical protein